MLAAINKKLDSALTVITIALMAALVIVVFFQVVNRMYFRLVLPWTEEFSRFLFVWVSLCAAAKCTYNRSHIIVDLLPAVWPGKKSDTVLFIASFFTLIFYALIVYYGFSWAFRTAGRFPATMQVNLLYIHLVLPVTFTLMVLFHVQHMIDDFKKLFLSKDDSKNNENGGE